MGLTLLNCFGGDELLPEPLFHAEPVPGALGLTTCLILAPPMSEFLGTPTPDNDLDDEDAIDARLDVTHNCVRMVLSPIEWSIAVFMSVLNLLKCSFTLRWTSASMSWGS